MFKNSPANSLESFQDQAFARHLLYDFPFPIVNTFPLVAILSWLLIDRAAPGVIALWVSFTAAAVAARWLFVQRMKRQFSGGRGYRSTLRGIALLNIPLGAVSGVFAWLYFDASAAMNMVILGFYMVIVIVGAITPLSIYPPSFFMLVLPAHLPYLYLLASSNSRTHAVLAGLDVLLLAVVYQYTLSAHRLHRETTRLRFENQRLIDDLEQEHTALAQAVRDKSHFLAGVSHDLKQPIRAIAMYAGYLRHRPGQDDSTHDIVETADKIEAAVGTIHGQISRLLELSRLESGAMPIALQPVPLQELMEQLLSSVAPEAQSRGIQLRFAIGRCAGVLADRPRLESILGNLLINAIKHSRSERVYIGTRWRATHSAGRQLCIEVRDKGCGIEAARLPQLFDAYRSFDDRQASECHGLGLAIAKAHASQMACELSVRSAPGCGSTFTLSGLSPAA